MLQPSSRHRGDVSAFTRAEQQLLKASHSPEPGCARAVPDPQLSKPAAQLAAPQGKGPSIISGEEPQRPACGEVRAVLGAARLRQAPGGGPALRAEGAAVNMPTGQAQARSPPAGTWCRKLSTALSAGSATGRPRAGRWLSAFRGGLATREHGADTDGTGQQAVQEPVKRDAR